MIDRYSAVALFFFSLDCVWFLPLRPAIIFFFFYLVLVAFS